MKTREENRYLVRDMPADFILPAHLTASERLILMFLFLHYKENMKGATKTQILSTTGVGQRTFERAWKNLQRENLVISERLYTLTVEGQQAARLLVG